MKTYKRLFLGVLVSSMLVGCGASRSVIRDDRQEVKKDIEAVLGNVVGQDVSLEDLKDQLRTDEQARTSIETIAETLSGTGASAKYCPVTGKRYSPKMEKCPEHGVVLEAVTRDP